MAKSYVETVLGGMEGERVTLVPRFAMVNDGPSLDALALIGGVAAPDRLLVYYDHDVPTGTIEAAERYHKLLDFTRAYGIRLRQAKGIGYSHMLRHEVAPGDIVACGGSHASLLGAARALGLNLSAAELARTIETGTCTLTVPSTLRASVIGSLPQDTDIMDAAMRFLARNPDIKGKALELYGLAAEDAETFCAMACDTGAFTAFAMEGSATHTDVCLDLSQTEPMLTLSCPTREEQSQAKRLPAKTLSGMPLNAGQIGGYTGGTIAALRRAAAMLKGRKLALGFRLSVVPATADDYLAAMEEGLLDQFIDYGAQINAVGDRSVIVHGAGTVDGYENMVTTGLYTFDGCMGSKGGQVLTASVPTIVKASYTKSL